MQLLQYLFKYISGHGELGAAAAKIKTRLNRMFNHFIYHWMKLELITKQQTEERERKKH